MKNIIKVDTKQAKEVNKLLGKNYSTEILESLISSGVIKVYQLNDLGELPIFYSQKLESKDITNSILVNLKKNVSDFICDLGKEKCNNILISEKNCLILEVIDESILKNDLDIFCITSYINEECVYYRKGKKRDFLIGYDAPSYHRDFRCFNKESQLNFEKSINKISAILNIDGRLTFTFNKKYNCYYIYLDNNILGVWSNELIKDFLEESYDIYYSENHIESECMECIHEEECKYANSDKTFEKELLSDKINIPPFSIMALCKTLGIEVLEKE